MERKWNVGARVRDRRNPSRYGTIVGNDGSAYLRVQFDDRTTIVAPDRAWYLDDRGHPRYHLVAPAFPRTWSLVFRGRLELV